MHFGAVDSSVVMNTDYSFRGPVFNSQHLCGGSQLPGTPVSGDPTSSSGLYRHLHIHGAQTHAGMKKGKRVFICWGEVWVWEMTRCVRELATQA